MAVQRDGSFRGMMGRKQKAVDEKFYTFHQPIAAFRLEGAWRLLKWGSRGRLILPRGITFLRFSYFATVPKEGGDMKCSSFHICCHFISANANDNSPQGKLHPIERRCLKMVIISHERQSLSLFRF
ncbi:MAG: hypothetical protein IJD86_07205 [Clostridia bacterium]|nr:hypothetical protein [Clostridia bacterium]